MFLGAVSIVYNFILSIGSLGTLSVNNLIKLLRVAEILNALHFCLVEY